MSAHSPLPLADRLRPTRLDDVIGNPQARAQLRKWAEGWASAGGPPAPRAAVLSGPPGVGKTSAALALAHDFGWSVVEMNASDARNERAIEQVAGRASITHSLMESASGSGPPRALILLDEADSLSGRAVEAARSAPAPPTLKEFLRARYGTVEALNAGWGLAPKGKPAPFESWDSVPRSPGNHAWARLPAARKDLDDWKGSGRSRDLSDRGGLGAIARLVRATRQPLVLTVNDDRVLSRYSAVFRTSVARVRFYPIRDRELAAQLSAIAQRERIDLATGAIDAIVRRSGGDVRAALNDLDAIAPLPPGPLQLSVLGTRDRTAEFAAFTEHVLSAARYFRSVEVQDRLDATPDDLFPWIEENVPHFAPDAAHRSVGFDRLAAAELSLARARRFRVWGQWSYASELMTGGVGVALRDAPIPAVGRAQFPRFLAEMGGSRVARGLRDGIARKAGARLHLSRAKVRESVLPFLDQWFASLSGRTRGRDSDPTAQRVVRELELTPEEVAYLLRAEPDSAAVAALLGTEPEGGGDRRSGETPVPAASGPPSDPDATPASADSAGGSRRVQRQLSDFGGR